MKTLHLAGLLALACTAPSIAFAAADTSVSLPWGDWIAQLIAGGKPVVDTLVPLIYAGLFALITQTVGAPVAMIAKQFFTEKSLKAAIGYAINAVEGATHDGTLTVNVGSSVIAEAVNYFVAHVPGWLVQFLGGPDAIGRMILARIKIDPTGTAAAVGVTPPPPAKASSGGSNTVGRAK